MGINRNMKDLVPGLNRTSGPEMMGVPPIGPPDSVFALGYELFIITGIIILTLFSLPRTIRFLRSERRGEGWLFNHSASSVNSNLKPRYPTIQITGYKSQIGEEGVKIELPRVHTIVFPAVHENVDHSFGLSGGGSDVENSYTRADIVRTVAQPTLRQQQGAIAARMDWMYAKMSKYIGGPVSMYSGPWLVVFLINIVANALFTLAPPFFVSPDRVAHIAVAQIPILFILGTKNNIISCMLGKSYEKLNFVHRTVGRLLAMCATLHVVGQFIKYSMRGVLGQVMRIPWVQAGLAAWIGVLLITLSSIGSVRIKFYGLFLNSHYIGISLFIIAIHFHNPAVVAPYTIFGLSFYFVDLLLRAFKMRLRPATIIAIDDQMTLIAVQGIDNGWRAGQHIWLRILEGDRSWESHPFTIANAPMSHTPAAVGVKGLPSRGLLLYARAAGNFTCALNADARLHSGIEASVVVDGPYGGISAGMADVADNKNVLLIAGGGGASFTIALLEDLISGSLERKACTEMADFIWVVKDYAHLSWFMTTIEQIISAADGSAISLRVRLYVTNAQTAPKELAAFPPPSGSSRSLPNFRLGDAVEVAFNRPDVPTLVGEAVNYAALSGQSSAGGGGLMIVTCGPVPMIRDVQLATRRISVRDRRFAGGVSLHTEAFGL